MWQTILFAIAEKLLIKLIESEELEELAKTIVKTLLHRDDSEIDDDSHNKLVDEIDKQQSKARFKGRKPKHKRHH